MFSCLSCTCVLLYRAGCDRTDRRVLPNNRNKARSYSRLGVEAVCTSASGRVLGSVPRAKHPNNSFGRCYLTRIFVTCFCCVMIGMAMCVCVVDGGANTPQKVLVICIHIYIASCFLLYKGSFVSISVLSLTVKLITSMK